MIRDAGLMILLGLINACYVTSFVLPNDWSDWYFQSSLVLNNWLYIDSGEYYTLASGQTTPGFNILKTTIAISLNESWTNETVNAVSSGKPSGFGYTRAPVMFHNPSDNTVYEWGGWVYDLNVHDQLWAFRPDGHGGGSWSQEQPPTAQGQRVRSVFQAATVRTPSKFYSLGGVLWPKDGGEPSISIAGLTVFDFKSNSWSNISSEGATDSGWLVSGRGHFSPMFGEEGVLVFLGGVAPPNQTYGYLNQTTGTVDMSNITVYDIHSGKWYHQRAEGQVPPGRQQFCSVDVSSSSSFEIVVFGGATNFTYDFINVAGDTLSSVYVLSLPAFTWVKAENSASARRAFHTCELVGKRQMAVIGGVDPASLQSETGKWQDPWSNGIGIFDITRLTWSSGFDAKAGDYEPADILKSRYKTSSSPTSWANPDLSNIFVVRSPSASTGSGASNSSSSSPPKYRGNNVGVIVGATVGGAVALLFIAGMILVDHRRRQRARDSQRPLEGGYRTVDRKEAPIQPQMGFAELEGPPVRELQGHGIHEAPDQSLPQELAEKEPT